MGEGPWAEAVHGDHNDLERLAETGDARVLASLAEALNCDRWDWRLRAIEAASSMPKEQSTQLLKVAAQDPDQRVASQARSGISAPTPRRPERKQRKAPAPVHREAEVDAAASAPEHAEAPSARREVRPSREEITTAQAVAMLRSAEPGERARGAAEAARMRHTESVPQLIELLRDAVAEVKVAALSALVSLGDKRALMPALALTSDRNATVRNAAVTASKALNAFEFFRDGLSDKDAGVRKAALENLGKLGDERAIPLLKDFLTDEPAWRDAAATALGKLGHSKWDVWVNGDRDDFFRLAKSGDKEATQILVKAAASPSAEIRKAAAEALGFVEAATAFPVLLKLLSDRYEFASISAIASLGQLGDRRAVPALVDMLSDMNWLKRTSAAMALGRINSPDSVGPLIATLRDDTGAVRREVVTALGRSMSPVAVEPLVPALYDAEEDVRNAAKDSLKKLSEGLGATHKAEVNRALWALMEASNYYRAKKEGGKAAMPQSYRDSFKQPGRR
jgi:HEAT repeat protein